MDLSQHAAIAASHYFYHDHPVLILDLDQVRQQYRAFKAALPPVEVHYALKALGDPEVLKILDAEGASFEVASIMELYHLKEVLRRPLPDVYYSNPVKSRSAISASLKEGIRWFSIDTVEELHKLHEVAIADKIDTSKLKPYVRLAPEMVIKSAWPLSKKFGCNTHDFYHIIQHLSLLDMKLAGLTFHVGSQCWEPDAWQRAVDMIWKHIEDARGNHILADDAIINLGGGFPVGLQDIRLSHPEPTIGEIGQCMKFREHIRYAAEPGRFMVSQSGVLATRIIGKSTKNGEKRLTLDAGVFHGLFEAESKLMGKVHCLKDGPTEEFRLMGPSCDSVDMIPIPIKLPVTIEEGDVLFIEHSGAYCLAYSTGAPRHGVEGFNGFYSPSVRYLGDKYGP